MKGGAGLDLGRSSVRLAEIKLRKGGPVLSRYRVAPLEPGETPAQAAGASFGGLKGKLKPVRVGLTGVDLMLHYLPVPPVEDWRLERLMAFEVSEFESKSGSSLATSFNLLPVPKELDDEDTILLGMVREEILDDWTDEVGSLPVQAFTPNAVALYNAFLALGDHEPAVTLLANIGAGTLDLALVRGSQLYFARSVTTDLAKRDETLAARLGTDAQRAGRLIEKHLDLKAAAEGTLAGDADRVTRPLLGLYDRLPTLLSGIVTLCKAKARLRDLTLDRVLITGGGARAQGMADFLTDRMRVPVSVWNPVEMLDLAALPDADADEAEGDGPGAAVAIGLALSAADPELYALEILPKATRKKREFQERGVYLVLAGVLAVAFLVADFVLTSQRASAASEFAGRLSRQVAARESSHRRTESLLEEIERDQAVLHELHVRYGVRRSAQQILGHLSEKLPGTLWVSGVEIVPEDGDEWGMPDRSVPVVRARGHGRDGSLPASSVFATFGEELKALVPAGEAGIRNTAKGSGQTFEWGVEAHLLTPPASGEEEEPE